MNLGVWIVGGLALAALCLAAVGLWSAGAIASRLAALRHEWRTWGRSQKLPLQVEVDQLRQEVAELKKELDELRAEKRGTEQRRERDEAKLADMRKHNPPGAVKAIS